MSEYVALDLDADLLYHLAIPESVRVLVAEKVQPELVEDEWVRGIYEWQVAHTRAHKKPASAAVIEHEYEDVALDEPQTVINDLIARLRERYLKNNGREILLGLKDAYKKNPASLAHEMAEKGRYLTELTSKRGDAFGNGDIDRAIELYHQRVARGRGPSFGYQEVDNHFHGQEGISVLLGAPKSYKSWFATISALRNIEDGKNVWLYPLELPADQADWRLMCAAADVPYWKYLRGRMDKEDLERVTEAAVLLDGLGTYTIQKPPPGERDIDTLFERAADHGADLIVIDQLQYVESQRQYDRIALGQGKPDDYWKVLNRARDLSDHIPIQIVHQFNRSVMGADSMPEMQQAKGAAAIEEVATVVMGLWANKDMRDSNVVQFGALASRNYGTPKWQVGVELSRGCHFELRNEVIDDDE